MLAPVILDIACRTASALPPGAREVVARGIAALQYRLDGRRRRAVLANLSAIAASGARPGLEDPRVRDRTAREQFAGYLAFLLEHLAHRRLDAPALPERIRWSGMERLYAALGRGRGAVVSVAHLGNWEMAGLALARLGFAVHVVTGVQWHPALTGTARALKERARIRVSTAGDGFLPLLATLRAGGLVVLLVDGDVYSRALPARFFGRAVPFPAGPAILARRSGAALLHAHSERCGGDRWRVSFDGLDVPDRGLPVEEDLRRLTSRAAAAQERNIAALLEQWCIFRPMFPEVRDAAGATEQARAA
jgi:KDO2-lipid IV(A) lauroyltransferase